MNEKLSDFTRAIHGKKVAVIGIAVSNTPLIEFLSKRGARVTAFDRSDANALADRIERLRPCNVEYRLGPDYLSGLTGFDLIFKTPVIRPDIPELNAERARGATVTSEMELFLQLCPATVFGVTGSDGKTTTTTLIYEILKNHGYACHLGGNIGRPLLPDVESMSADDMAVVELSSFQLLTMTQSVNVAVVTNLSPNHLDVHTSYGEYVDAKKNIFAHQSPGDLTILNYDDDQTRAFGAETTGRLCYFSVTGGEKITNLFDASKAIQKPVDFAYINNSEIVYKSYHKRVAGGYAGDVNGAARVLRLEDINIPGRHNVENYLAAICAVFDYTNRRDIEKAAGTFTGVEHRIEFIRKLDGVKYYNDSSASSPSRTIACLKAFNQKVILIAGGKDKDLDFAPLGQYLADKVKLLILCGQTSDKIRQSLMDYCVVNEIHCPVKIVDSNSYEDAANAARAYASVNDVVVLSPAGTSFDRFKNFEERGRAFKNIINKL